MSDISKYSNAYNIDIMKELIDFSIDTSYKKLYDFQKTINGIERYSVPLSTYLNESPYSISYNINASLSDGHKRLLYIKSPLKGKVMSYTDIFKNINIFDKVPLVFIDGVLYTNISIKQMNENLYIYVNFRRTSTTSSEISYTWQEFNLMINSGVNVDIILLPSMNLKYKLDFPLSEIQSNINKGISLTGFTNLNSKKQTNTLLSFMNYSKYLFMYQLSPVTVDNGMVKYQKSLMDKLDVSKMKNVRAYLFSTPNLLNTISVPHGTNYFSIGIKDMPVPVESMLIFKKSEYGYVYDRDTTLTMYYPNIYKVNKSLNNDKDLLIYIFYSDITNTNIGSKYTNELDLYHRHTTNLLQLYENNTIDEFIKEYKPKEIVFSDSDFNLSEQYPYRDDYIKTRFIELISSNGSIYKEYLTKVLPNTREIYIDISKIDLSKRIRNNNKKEINNEELYETFSTPHYLLKFTYDGFNDKMNIWVDGLFIVPTIYNDSLYQYVYIPMDRVKPNSIMLIERFHDIETSVDFTYDSIEDYTEIHTDTIININDVFLTGTDIDGNIYHIYDDEYSLYIRNDNNEFVLATGYPFYSTDVICVKMSTDKYILDTLQLRTSVKNINKKITGDNGVDINDIISYDMNHMNVYLNGRMVLNSTVDFGFNHSAGGPHHIKFISLVKPTDVVSVSYTPVYRKKIVEMNTFDENGYIDLHGIIDKPFDIKWFDIFINGVKLHKNQIVYITPYKILIKNFNSRKHLIIYEKYFNSMDIAGNIDINDTILNNYPTILDNLISGNIVPDDLSDIGEVVLAVLPIIEEFLLGMTLINPDTLQFSRTITQQKHYLFTEQKVLFINPDNMELTIDNDYEFNPDKII